MNVKRKLRWLNLAVPILVAGWLAAPAYAEIKFEFVPAAEKELKLIGTTRSYSVEFEPVSTAIAKITCNKAALEAGSNIKGTKVPGTAVVHLKLSECSGSYGGMACTAAELNLKPWEGELAEVTGPNEFKGDDAAVMKPKEKGGFAELSLTSCGTRGSVSELIVGSIPMIVEPSGKEAVEVTLKFIQSTVTVKTKAKTTEKPTLEAFGRHVFFEGASGYEVPEKLFWGAR